MATDKRRVWKPEVPIAPGETIREILDERAVSQVDFATRMGKSEKFISQLVNGKAPISHDTAIELERVLGVPSSFWNAAEATYRDLLARQRQEAESAEQAEWARSFPLKDMASHGWITRENTPAEQTEELLAFFGVSSIEAYQDYWGAEKRLAARMSSAYTAETPAIAAWLRAGEREAEQLPTNPYNEAVFRKVLGDLRSATRLAPDEWLPVVAEECASAGVAAVFVRDLPKTRCHAVSWWPSRSRAVIQLGLRYKTDDQLWFSFFHEAGHLLLDDRSRTRISDLNGDELAEARANDFAADHLIPPREYTEFTSHGGRPSRADVVAFADRLGIAPSIVVGRLQRDKLIPYTWMNDLKTALEWA
ncbi:MAG: XRE family transcriptional regulator [Actinobacteria bacterium HGW-Actinobacteria-7]|nr:MAG: XRE family transcriptional regulator [Actinobacteria bacterium HGW-Actinobacteria-7]